MAIDPGIAALLARLREDAHNETGQLGLYARELLALAGPDAAAPDRASGGLLTYWCTGECGGPFRGGTGHLHALGGRVVIEGGE